MADNVETRVQEAQRMFDEALAHIARSVGVAVIPTHFAKQFVDPDSGAPITQIVSGLQYRPIDNWQAPQPPMAAPGSKTE